MSENEIDRVVKRYERRTLFAHKNEYYMFNPTVWLRVQERERKLISLLSKNISKPLNDTSVLEIGCGTGGNILELIRFGFNPKNIVANELLSERLELLQMRLPSSCKIIGGDASELSFNSFTFDIVYQSTVFSSLLDDDFQNKLAEKMWSLVKPGGAVLWYDFIYNNPKNPDVRGVTLKRIKELFPEASISYTRTTLAPPLSRMVTKIHPVFYPLFNFFPFLRTHVLCWISKPIKDYE